MTKGLVRYDILKPRGLFVVLGSPMEMHGLSGDKYYNLTIEGTTEYQQPPCGPRADQSRGIIRVRAACSFETPNMPPPGLRLLFTPHSEVGSLPVCLWATPRLVLTTLQLAKELWFSGQLAKRHIQAHLL